MTFLRSLIGEDLSITQDSYHINRNKEIRQVINNKTLVFYPHLITQGTIIGFTCNFDLNQLGFGKIGLTSVDPYKVNVKNLNLLNLINNQFSNDDDDDDINMKHYHGDTNLMELPKFDLESISFTHDWSTDSSLFYLLIVCGYNGRISVFINFNFIGKLQVQSELVSGGVSLFFDLSGPFISLDLLEKPYSIADEDMFEDDEGWLKYCGELASYGGILLNKNNLGCIYEDLGNNNNNEDDEQNQIIDKVLEDLFLKCKEKKNYMRQKKLLCKFDLQTGTMMPTVVSWKEDNVVVGNNEYLDKEVDEFERDGLKQRENTDLESLLGKSENNVDITEFVNAELRATKVINQMLSSNTKRTSNQSNEKKFSFSNLRENEKIQSNTSLSTSDLSESQLNLIEILIEFFMKQKQKSSSQKKVVTKKYSKEQLYCQISFPSERTLEVDLEFYKSLGQFEMLLSISAISHSPFLLVLGIQKYIVNCKENNTEEMLELIEKWCLLMNQRAAGHFIHKSLLFLFLYDQKQIEKTITQEVFFKNLSTIRNSITELCCQVEFKEMMFEEPIFLNTSNQNYSTELQEVLNCLCQVVLNKGYFIPQRWSRLLTTTNNMQKAGTKLLSMSQTCQISADLGLKTVNDVSAALAWLDAVGLVHWCPHGSSGHYLGSGVHSGLCRVRRDSSLLTDQQHARILILDYIWILQLTATLIHEVSSSNLRSIDVLHSVMKPYSYHKPLLLSLFRQSGLITSTSDSQLYKSVSVLDFPGTPSLKSNNKKNSKEPNSILTWYIQFSVSPPWLSLVSIFIRVLSMCDDSQQPPLPNNKTLVTSCHVNHEELSVELCFYGDNNGGLNLHVNIESPSQLRVSITTQSTLPSNKHTDLIGSIQVFMEQQARLMLMRPPLYRIGVTSGVECPCNRINQKSKKAVIKKRVSTAHILKLDEVLCNNAVYCGEGGNRLRISTEQWRSMFSTPINSRYQSETNQKAAQTSLVISDPIILDKSFSFSSIKNMNEFLLPDWLKKLSRLLTSSNRNQLNSSNKNLRDFDWRNLAEILGYHDESIHKFEVQLNGALCLLVDWIITSGNSRLSVEFLSIALQEAGQYSVADFVDEQLKTNESLDSSSLNSSVSEAQVFVSYQWHNRTEARAIADYLIQHGVSVWMDIGPTLSNTANSNTGMHLLHRIERALRRCQVLIACITPRYIVSPFCHRELVLTELLGKPIVPVMLSRVPWPPPGGSGLLLAPYVYIDLLGVGGHGGTGKNSDVSARMAEILTRVSKYIEIPLPKPKPQVSATSDSIKPSDTNSSSQLNIIYPLLQSSNSTNTLQLHTQIPTQQISQQSSPNHHAPPQQQHLRVASRTSVRECSSICIIL